MLKTFPIEFVRQILEQTLYEEHMKDVNLFGGEEQVNILSFYEQLKSQDEVDRFIETYRDLSEQQNRTGLILNGVLVSPENPTVTNLYSCTIVPLTWTCSLRCKLENRDQAIVTINNLIEKLKGKKVDVAQLECVDDNGKIYYQPFKVGTIGQNEGASVLKNGDYIGNYGPNRFDDFLSMITGHSKQVGIGKINKEKSFFYYNEGDFINGVRQYKLNILKTIPVPSTTQIGYTLGYIWGLPNGEVQPFIDITSSNITIDDIYEPIYADFTITKDGVAQTFEHCQSFALVDRRTTSHPNQLSIRFKLPIDDNLQNYEISISNMVLYKSTCEADYVSIRETDVSVAMPPTHNSFERYKVSMSFDSIRCDEPRTVNGSEYCEITFSGSATIVNHSVVLGNDLLKIALLKVRIDADTPIEFSNQPIYYLEPLEMPSGNNINTQVSQLVSTRFLTNTHADAMSPTLQYTFILDRDNELLNQLFYYGRYGMKGFDHSVIDINSITPNMVFRLAEIWSSWGDYQWRGMEVKIVENVDIENTESDTLTLSLTMQIQKENV